MATAHTTSLCDSVQKVRILLGRSGAEIASTGKLTGCI